MKTENGRTLEIIRGKDVARSVVEGLRRELTLWKSENNPDSVDFLAAVGSWGRSDPVGTNPLFINKSDAKDFGQGNNLVFRIPINLDGDVPFPHKELWLPIAR